MLIGPGPAGPPATADRRPEAIATHEINKPGPPSQADTMHAITGHDRNPHIYGPIRGMTAWPHNSVDTAPWDEGAAVDRHASVDAASRFALTP